MTSRRQFFKLVGASGLMISAGMFDKGFGYNNKSLGEYTNPKTCETLQCAEDFVLDLENVASWSNSVDNNLLYIPIPGSLADHQYRQGRIDETMQIDLAADNKYMNFLQHHLVSNAEVLIKSERLGLERRGLVSSVSMQLPRRHEIIDSGTSMFDIVPIEISLDINLLADRV